MGLACLAASASSVAHACRAIRVDRCVAHPVASTSIGVDGCVAHPVARSSIRVDRCVAHPVASSSIGVDSCVAHPVARSSIGVNRCVAHGETGRSRRGNVPIRLSGRCACSYQCNTAYQCLNLIHRKFLKLVVPSMAVRSSVTPTVSAMGLRKD
jgi:hypothetical protein